MPDGKVIVLEGTPEEIAAYERGERAGKPIAKKPSVLRGRGIPMVTDYCTACGESPDSGSHQFDHEYRDPYEAFFGS